MKKKLTYLMDLILVLTSKEIKVRYKNNILGYLWSVAMPLCYSIVYYVAFKVVMRIRTENYALFLICGLFPWQWFANSIGASATVLLANSSIIKKVNFPRSALCVATVLNDGVHLLLSVPVIILFLFFYNEFPGIIWLVGIFLLFFIQFLLVTGISLVVSSINLFFRDLERLVQVFLTFLFYFTPIIYSETMIPEKYRYLLNFNPVAPLMVAWRELFLHSMLDWRGILVSFVYSFVAFIFGLFVFRKLSPRFAEVL